MYAGVAGLKSEIQAANVKFMDAFAKGDAEGVGALYTSDCKIMPTGSDVVTGQQGMYSILPPQIIIYKITSNIAMWRGGIWWPIILFNEDQSRHYQNHSSNF